MADEGQWVTINGQHILIKDGESPMSAYIRHLNKIRNEKKAQTIEKINKSYKLREEKEKESEAERRADFEKSFPKTPEKEVIEEITGIMEEKYKMSNPYIAYGEITQEGNTPTREEIIEYYQKQGEKTGNEDMIEKAEKFANDYLNFTKKIPELKKQLLEEKKKRK